MKIFYLLLFLNLISHEVFSQCSGCIINSSYTSPGIYPDTLPEGIQNQIYNEDVTFVMFTDTSGLTVNSFQITGVSGLPFGLDWECNNSSNNCIYDPAQSIYGCVKVCGTPIQSGSFNIAVNVIANLQVVGNQNSVINIFLNIQPVSGGNSSFSFSPSSSCDSITTTFTALINGSPNITTYNWDFGNGNNSTLANPPSQTYSSAGNYPVTLQTDISAYILNDLVVNSVNDNWCGDVEEPSIPFIGCTGSPDIYFVLSDANGNVVYTSGVNDNSTTASFTGLNVLLDNPPYSFTLTDEDLISVADDLGTFSFNVNGIGTNNYSGAGGTSGSYTIGTTLITSFSNTDTVHVYSQPVQPIITSFMIDTFCNGDLVNLEVSNLDAVSYQWYIDSIELSNETDIIYSASASGDYTVIATNTNGCSAESESYSLTELAPIPNVNFSINGNTLTCFLTGYNFQWNLNDTAIIGANSNIYTITESGVYTLTACNSFGCCRTSASLSLNYINGLEDINSNNVISIYPNPVNDILYVITTSNINNGSIQLLDVLGRKILNSNYNIVHNQNQYSIDVSRLSSGIYFISFRNEKGSTIRKFIKE